MRARIEAKPYDAEAAAETLLGALRGAEKREITAADAGVLSGLPLDRCEAALILLGKRFESRVRVTASGDLLFTFASLDTPRRAGRLSRVRAALRRAAVRVIALLSWILVPDLALCAAANVYALGLVVSTLPVLLEIVLILPIAIAGVMLFAVGFMGFVLTQLAPVIGTALVLLGLFLPVFVFFAAVLGGDYPILLAELLLVPICVALVRMFFPILRDLRSGARHVISEEGIADVKRFFAVASGFLLGPPPLDADGLDDERRVVAFLRAHEGILTTGDVMALLGVARDEAERETTRILADYDGSIEVAKDVLVFRFDALLRTTGEAADVASPPLAWDRETPPRFFGCDAGTAKALLFFALLATLGLWLHPALVLFPTADFYARIDMGASSPPVALLEGVGAWPFVVPAGILLARMPFHLAALHAYRRRAALFSLLRPAYTKPAGLDVRAVNTAQLVSLGGAIDADATRADGTLRLVFATLAGERRAAKAARAAARKTRTSRGEVVFDSEDAGG